MRPDQRKEKRIGLSTPWNAAPVLTYMALALITARPAAAQAITYAGPGAPASDNPAAYSPGSASMFLKDIKLPEVEHYVNEVLRVTRGGFFPATVAQLAVIAPGKPVQALLIHAVGHAPWKVRSQQTGVLAWADYVELRQKMFKLIKAEAIVAEQDNPSLATVCTDDGTGAVEYSGGYKNGITVSFSRCEDTASIAFGNELLRMVEASVAPPRAG